MPVGFPAGAAGPVSDRVSRLGRVLDVVLHWTRPFCTHRSLSAVPGRRRHCRATPAGSVCEVVSDVATQFSEEFFILFGLLRTFTTVIT